MMIDNNSVSTWSLRIMLLPYLYRTIMTLFDNILEPKVTLPIFSSNLHLHLPNNPKNAPQHLPKMPSSDDYLPTLLFRISHRCNIVRHRRHCWLSMGGQTLLGVQLCTRYFYQVRFLIFLCWRCHWHFSRAYQSISDDAMSPTLSLGSMITRLRPDRAFALMSISVPPDKFKDLWEIHYITVDANPFFSAQA